MLAVGYEALGQRDKAEEQYLAMLKAKPEVADLRDAAAFYLRGGDVQEGRAAAASGSSTARGGRTRRGRLGAADPGPGLGASGDYKQSQDALDLLNDEPARPKRPGRPARPGHRAGLAAGRAAGNRSRTLEESFTHLRPTPDEEFLLARLYEADRDWDQANKHFLAVVGAKGGANPMHLAYYVSALLRRKDVNERGPATCRPGEGRSGQLSARGA